MVGDQRREDEQQGADHDGHSAKADQSWHPPGGLLGIHEAAQRGSTEQKGEAHSD